MNSPEETRKTEKSETVAKGNKKSTETGNGLWGENTTSFGLGTRRNSNHKLGIYLRSVNDYHLKCARLPPKNQLLEKHNRTPRHPLSLTPLTIPPKEKEWKDPNGNICFLCLSSLSGCQTKAAGGKRMKETEREWERVRVWEREDSGESKWNNGLQWEELANCCLNSLALHMSNGLIEGIPIYSILLSNCSWLIRHRHGVADI